jgi:hypothetical protein
LSGPAVVYKAGIAAYSRYRRQTASAFDCRRLTFMEAQLNFHSCRHIENESVKKKQQPHSVSQAQISMAKC